RGQLGLAFRSALPQGLEAGAQTVEVTDRGRLGQALGEALDGLVDLVAAELGQACLEQRDLRLELEEAPDVEAQRLSALRAGVLADAALTGSLANPHGAVRVHTTPAGGLSGLLGVVDRNRHDGGSRGGGRAGGRRVRHG